MVRQAREENLPGIQALIQAALDEARKEDFCQAAVRYRDRLEEHLEGDTFWCYLLDGKEAAVLGVENKNHISLCFTDPAYRGRGAAKELFEGVKAVLLARGFFEITADATPSSQEFFRKLGFRTAKKEDGSLFMIYGF